MTASATSSLVTSNTSSLATSNTGVGAMLGALERANVPEAKIGKDWGACELYIKDGDSRPRYLGKLQNGKTWDIDEAASKSVTVTSAHTIKTNAQVRRN